MKTVMITCENDVMLYKDLIAKDIREWCAFMISCRFIKRHIGSISAI